MKIIKLTGIMTALALSATVLLTGCGDGTSEKSSSIDSDSSVGSSFSSNVAEQVNTSDSVLGSEPDSTSSTGGILLAPSTADDSTVKERPESSKSEDKASTSSQSVTVGGNTGYSDGETVQIPVAEPAPHVHNYTEVVSSNPGNCCTTGTITKQCSCGDQQTTATTLGDHQWEYIEEQKQWVPDYEYAYQCNKCHKQFGDDDDAAVLHVVAERGCGYSYAVTGLSETEGTWHVISEAYYYCPICCEVKHPA